jgi:hypothetical protein
MNRTPVTSSSVRSVGYDPSHQTLEIEFNSSGFVYRYLDVPRYVFDDIMSPNQPSIGSYVARYVKGKYSSEKLLF